MGSKQEELEAIVQQEGFDVVTVTETWWDDCHHGSSAMAGYKPVLIDQVPWNSVLKGKEVQEGWMCFKKELLNIQERTVPMCGKTSCMGKRPVWLNRELKLECRGEREYIISGRRVR